MVQKEITYRKLPGVKRKFVGKDKLWMGPDHLLLVESSGISETYKRFYFKDIQAVNIIKTRKSLVVNSFLISIFLILGLAGFYLWSGSNIPGAVFFWIISGVLLTYAILNIIQGVSCDFWLYTFVQKEKIKPLKSVRAVSKAMSIIVPEIENAQGRLSPQSFENIGLKIKSSFKKDPEISQNRQPVSSFWHSLLFLLLIILGIYLATTLYIHPVSYLIFGTFLFLVTLAASVIVIAKQAGSLISMPLKTVSWVTMASLLLLLGISYIELIYITFLNLPKTNNFSALNQFWIYEHFAKMNPFENTVILTINIFEVIVCLGLGIIGFLLIYNEQE